MIISSVKPENFEEVLEFMIRCDIAEFGEPDSNREDLEQLWNEIDLSQDAWIIRDEQQRLTGFANVSDAVDGFQMDLYIHPLETPAGIEEDLMDLCLKRVQIKLEGAPQGDPTTLIGYATSINARLQQVYEKSGFSRHTYHYRMQINLTAPLAAPAWPSNFHLAAYRPEDELELYTLIQQAFDWEGHKDTPIELWRNLVFRGGRFEPDLFVLVWDGARLVGAALTYDDGDSGWIRQLAFSKDYRGQGLGSLLLRQMFSIFQQRGARSVALGVASVNETAHQFYERNGMYRSRVFIEYRRTLTNNIHV